MSPSLIPTRSGDRVKTDKRDAAKLAKNLRANDLVAVHTRQQTILRMTTAASNAWMTTGFSRRNGHGDGEPRLPHGIWRNFLMFRTARPDTEPRNPIKPLSAGAQRPHSTGILPAQSLVLIEGLQTQNA